MKHSLDKFYRFNEFSTFSVYSNGTYFNKVFGILSVATSDQGQNVWEFGLA